MKKFWKIALISTAVSAIIYFGLALILTFLPEPTFAVDPFPVAQTAVTDDFTPQQYTMRDGETLFARQFTADSDTTILLLHGVTSESAALSGSAQKLRQISGAEVVALDLRGHGQSGGTCGDVSYIGQYQDDVADVISAIHAEKPNGRLILAGHSMGGGIALQFAQLAETPGVDGYLMFAPHLGTNAPTLPEPDPLTDRELDVLRKLQTDLTGPEIARELMISLNTMRTHTKNIYAKLRVNSRRTAVRRAEELNLL